MVRYVIQVIPIEKLRLKTRNHRIDNLGRHFGYSGEGKLLHCAKITWVASLRLYCERKKKKKVNFFLFIFFLLFVFVFLDTVVFFWNIYIYKSVK